MGYRHRGHGNYRRLPVRQQIDNERLLGLGGLLSVAFGILLLIWPNAALLSLVWLIGAYSIIWGITLIRLALRLRSLNSRGGSLPAGMNQGKA